MSVLQNSDETTASFPTTPNNATTGTNQNKILPSTNNQPGKELQNSEEDIESISTTPNNTATSYQNKQQRANGTIPYTRDYRKRHDTNLSYRRPRTRDFSWSDGSYNPRHSPRHTNFGKAQSYHGTYSNQRYTSNGRYRHQDPWANPRTHYNDESPAESHSRNYNYDYGYHPNETW
ncbi:hypothetical protein SK128_018177 [Halocaridina rubra]|uniref:Uncharacterized protein n=1 Tax=Halocaridina rubra TaxID=373956 RepID=A0AAN8WY06_HALRR